MEAVVSHYQVFQYSRELINLLFIWWAFSSTHCTEDNISILYEWLISSVNSYRYLSVGTENIIGRLVLFPIWVSNPRSLEYVYKVGQIITLRTTNEGSRERPSKTDCLPQTSLEIVSRRSVLTYWNPVHTIYLSSVNIILSYMSRQYSFSANICINDPQAFAKIWKAPQNSRYQKGDEASSTLRTHQ
jgi:hypothetical protein